MQHNIIPFFSGEREYQNLKDRIFDELPSCLETWKVVDAPVVKDLEKKVSEITNRSYGCALNSCTDALYFSLVALGIGPGHKVICPDFSFISTATSILRSGATPVFSEVDETYGLDINMVSEKLDEDTKAIIYVHMFGKAGKIKSIEKFCKEKGLFLIEDAAQGIGGEMNNRRIGSMGDCSCMSFSSTKPISAPGSGGMLLTDNESIYMRVKNFRRYGKDNTGKATEGIGTLSLMSAFTAKILEIKLEKINDWQDRRKAIAAFYIDQLSELNDIELPEQVFDDSHVFQKFVIKVGNRNLLKKYLANYKIPTNIYYPRPLSLEPCFDRMSEMTPVAKKTSELCAQVLALPIHAFLTDGEVEKIVKIIKNSLKKSG